MPVIIGVKFKFTNKIYYFDPKDIQFKENDGVIVETARGIEYGKVMVANKEVDEKEIVPPLKTVIRKATEADERQVEKNLKLKDEAIRLSLDKIEKLNPEMKLVDVEYTFDQSKIVFYFTADGRVDFRELVRQLASIFKRRIEMRQIDEREDLKMRGGLAQCGRQCCCSKFLSDCDKVSIKMAKTQGLPLSPTKISGLCGKLMCCLKYENDYYAEVVKKLPKNGVTVYTPDGEGVVVSTDALKQEVKVRFERSDGTEIKAYDLSKVRKDKNAPTQEDEIEQEPDTMLEE